MAVAKGLHRPSGPVTRSLSLAAMLALSAGGARAAAGAPDQPLLVVHGDASAPYSALGADGQVTGLKIDMLELVAARAGIAIREQARPWQRAQSMVEHGEADLLVIPETDEREAYAAFSRNALFYDTTVVLYLRNEAAAPRIAAAKSVGDLDGLAFVEYLGDGVQRRLLTGQKVAHVKDRDTALRMLAAGHAEAYIDALLPARQALARLSLDGLLDIRDIRPLDAYPYRIAIRRSLAEVDTLLARFDTAIEQASSDGSLDAVWRHYADGNRTDPSGAGLDARPGTGADALGRR